MSTALTRPPSQIAIDRATTLPENTDPASFGLANFAEVMPQLQNEAKARLLAAIAPPVEPEPGHAAISRVAKNTNRTQSGETMQSTA